tara:strand:- start:1639 stop:1881 length:243 start_codon:yes stop_codon:yes gene_type:complete
MKSIGLFFLTIFLISCSDPSHDIRYTYQICVEQDVSKKDQMKLIESCNKHFGEAFKSLNQENPLIKWNNNESQKKETKEP